MFDHVNYIFVPIGVTEFVKELNIKQRKDVEEIGFVCLLGIRLKEIDQRLYPSITSEYDSMVIMLHCKSFIHANYYFFHEVLRLPCKNWTTIRNRQILVFSCYMCPFPSLSMPLFLFVPNSNKVPNYLFYVAVVLAKRGGWLLSDHSKMDLLSVKLLGRCFGFSWFGSYGGVLGVCGFSLAEGECRYRCFLTVWECRGCDFSVPTKLDCPFLI